MKKNYLKSYPVAKTAKKPTRKTTKKNAAQLREDKITEVLSKVSEICDYAIDNLCTEQAQFEELEMLLRKYIN